MSHRISFSHVTLTDIDKIRKERVIDWLENGIHLEHLFEIAKAQYRQKICICKCDSVQKIKRGCVKGRGLDMYGAPVTHCMHLNDSANKKLEEKFNQHMSLHPAVSGKKWFVSKKTKSKNNLKAQPPIIKLKKSL